ncbi:MAG: hypothetical protein RIB61_10000 [Roseicyclus sp.]
MYRSLLVLTLALAAAPASATSHQDGCSSQLLATVELQMPHVGRDLDPADLSCNGLTRLFLLLTSPPDDVAPFTRQRQDIIAIFRREGLTH